MHRNSLQMINDVVKCLLNFSRYDANMLIQHVCKIHTKQVILILRKNTLGKYYQYYTVLMKKQRVMRVTLNTLCPTKPSRDCRHDRQVI